MFTEAEHLTRELCDHLERGVVPKIQSLGRAVRPTKGSDDPSLVEDGVVRNQAVQVLESDQFTEQLAEKLTRLLGAIDKNVERIVSGE